MFAPAAGVLTDGAAVATSCFWRRLRFEGADWLPRAAPPAPPPLVAAGAVGDDVPAAAMGLAANTHTPVIANGWLVVVGSQS